MIQQCKKILVVDDEQDISLILTSFLEMNGYQATSARDGVEAVEMVASLAPDLILMDVMMPDMSGYQVVRLLKSQPASRDIPVIMLTAKTEQSDRFWGLDSGADTYMNKPFELDDVLLEIQRLLGEKA